MCFGVVLFVFSLPAVHTSPAGVMTVTFFLIICVVLMQVPNQTRIKTIADMYAPGRAGTSRNVILQSKHKLMTAASSYDPCNRS
jgi:hypothetical protein